MGTWAAGSFGNDAAGDWVYELEENPTYEFLRETLQQGLDMLEDSDSNAAAIAAAEILCIVEGKLPADYDEENLGEPVASLKQEEMPDDLKALAISCLNAILEESELKELWEEAGDEEWTGEVKRVINFLQQTA